MIGRELVPELSRSRFAAYVSFVCSLATTLLAAMPAELWILPLALLSPERRRLFLATGAGIVAALLGLYLAGRTVGDAGVIPFLLETRGASVIASYQAAREMLGSAFPAAIGWIGPAARDAALMAGQRGFHPGLFTLGVTLQATLRLLLLAWICGRIHRTSSWIDHVKTCALPLWIVLGILSVWFR